MTLYARQQKRHRYEEQTFGLCGRRQGWDDLREQHWNMYISICEIDDQSKFDAWSRALRAGALGQPRGMGWGGKWKGVQDEGTHVHPWLVHVNVWQKPPQYCKVTSLKLISINFFKGCCLSPSICGHLLHSCGKTTIPKKHLHYKAGSMKEDEEGFI